MDLKILIMITLVFGGLEGLICRFSRRKIVKWILPVLLVLLSAALFTYGKFAPLEGMQDLAYLVTGMLAGIAAIMSFAVAIIDLILGKIREKKNQ